MLKQYEKLESRNQDLLTGYLKRKGRGYNSYMISKLIGQGFKHYVFVSQKGVVTNYVLKEELENTDQLTLQRLDKGLLLNKSQVLWLKDKLEIIDNFLISLANKNYQQLSNEQIWKLFYRYCKSFEHQTSVVYVMFRLDNALIQSIVKELKDFIYQKIKDDQLTNDWLGILSSPPHKSYLLQEEEDFFKILKETNSLNQLPSDLLEKHSQKYCWIPIQQDEDPWDTQYFIELLNNKIKQKKQSEKRLVELNNYISNLKKQQNDILAKLQPSFRIKKIITDLQNIGYIRDLRKVTYSKSKYYSRFLLDEIGHRIGLDQKDVGYLLPDEVESILLKKKKVSENEIKKRKEYSVLEFLKNEVNIFTGQKAKQKENFIKKLIPSDLEQSNIISGTPACTGMAKGKVKKILILKDSINFKLGEILVTRMTTPEVVPAMKKAAAIVTDEGGLTCHAAIVSRELGVPCIVGTKIATKVLKNGDLIKVDANKGVVKKLN